MSLDDDKNMPERQRKILHKQRTDVRTRNRFQCARQYPQHPVGPEAFDYAVTLCRSAVMRIRTRASLYSIDEEDLLQELVCRALAYTRAFETYRLEEAISLLAEQTVRIMHTQQHDDIRRMHVLAQEYVVESVLISSQEENQWLLLEALWDLPRALASLPQSLRITVKLFYDYEMCCSDIATLLSITPQAVRKRLYDARSKLQKRL